MDYESVDFEVSIDSKNNDMEHGKGIHALEIDCDDDTVTEVMLDNRKDSSKRSKHENSSDDEGKQIKLMKHTRNM